MHQQKQQTIKKTPKKSANNYNNIKIIELLSWVASLEKTVDVPKSELKECQHKII